MPQASRRHSRGRKKVQARPQGQTGRGAPSWGKNPKLASISAPSHFPWRHRCFFHLQVLVFPSPGLTPHRLPSPAAIFRSQHGGHRAGVSCRAWGRRGLAPGGRVGGATGGREARARGSDGACGEPAGLPGPGRCLLKSGSPWGLFPFLALLGQLGKGEVNAFGGEKKPNPNPKPKKTLEFWRVSFTWWCGTEQLPQAFVFCQKPLPLRRGVRAFFPAGWQRRGAVGGAGKDPGKGSGLWGDNGGQWVEEVWGGHLPDLWLPLIRGL